MDRLVPRMILRIPGLSNYPGSRFQKPVGSSFWAFLFLVIPLMDWVLSNGGVVDALFSSRRGIHWPVTIGLRDNLGESLYRFK